MAYDKGKGERFDDGNTAAVKHGLWMDESRLRETFDDEELQIVGQMSEELIEKYESVHGESPGVAEREMIRNLIYDTIKRRRANEYMMEQGVDLDTEGRHNVYSRLRRDNRDEMEALGLLKTPEASKQQAEADWFEAMQDAEDDE